MQLNLFAPRPLPVKSKPLFYLGTHEPSWLRRVDVPLFVSHRRLARLKRYQPATTSWALDSGGFTELNMYGAWNTSAADYVAAVRRYASEIGRMSWAATQDWMCEPYVLAKTGLHVDEHIRRTVDSYLQLVDMAPEIPWVPSLQGWRLEDYHRCADLYAQRGVILSSLPLVGVGSVCRRQHTDEARSIFASLHARGLRLHGFGLKIEGLRKSSAFLASADSMSWSKMERTEHIHRKGPNPCGHKGSCANCMAAALRWRQRVLDSM